jgi:hypothetical protein
METKAPSWRLPMKRLITAAALIGALAILVPHLGNAQESPQQSSGEKINQLIIYGEDPCPASPDGSITVCARKDEADRFRIPALLRGDAEASINQSWSERVKAYETVGAAGVNSCSPVGVSGASGCVTKLVNRAYAEKKQSSDIQFGKLIEEERAKRMQSIDSDTAAEQARVEVLEKAYEAKLAKERAAETAAPQLPVAGQGALTTPPQD